MRKYNFSPEQKEEIVELYVSGSTAPEIRRAFNIVGDSTVYSILHEYKVPLRLKKPGVTSRVEKIRQNKAIRNGVEVESDLPVDERLPEELPSNGRKKRFRVTLKVRLTFDADTMEAALAKAKGYNGYQEVLSVSRIG